MGKTLLRNIDLNLLIPLQALLEERSVTRAALRVHLSQPAMSRALERLRANIGDDLLTRVKGEYVLTSRGTELAQELSLLLPRIEQLWSAQNFSPAHSTGRIRMALTDNGANLMLPALMKYLQRDSPQLRVDVLPWRESSYDELQAGAIDLVFSPLAPPEPLKAEVLFIEHFVCLIDKNHSFRARAFTMRQYLSQRHINIETQPGQLTFVDRPLAEAGLRRTIALQLPYFIPAVHSLVGTELVVTVPSALVPGVLARCPIRLVRAPKELPSFHYLIVWHPRLDAEPLHSWFRQVVKDSCRIGGRIPA